MNNQPRPAVRFVATFNNRAAARAFDADLQIRGLAARSGLKDQTGITSTAGRFVVNGTADGETLYAAAAACHPRDGATARITEHATGAVICTVGL